MGLLTELLFKICTFIAWIYTLVWETINETVIPRKVVPPETQLEILNLSATTLAKKIRNEEIASFEVVTAFINRCKEVNPLINAIVEDRFEEAIEDARKVDKIIESHYYTIEELEEKKPLFGVPITIKESCGLINMSNVIGSKFRYGKKALENGRAVEYLINAGAIPIAVTNTPELCCAYETDNDVTGFTRNPYDWRRTAGGSSGGEAAILSSGGSALGIGTDFGGSIRVPSFYTGIFGHKPSSGVVSSDGHTPNSDDEVYQKMLCIGPMSRYAEDLKIGLKVISGIWADQLKLEEPVHLNELKIYYFVNESFEFSDIPVDDDIMSVIQKAVGHFQNEYNCETEDLNILEMKELRRICASAYSEIYNIAKGFRLKNPDKESNVFIEIAKACFRKSDYSFPFLIRRLAMEWFVDEIYDRRSKYALLKADLLNKLTKVLANKGVIFFPTLPTPVPYQGEIFDRFSATAFSLIVNIAGFPATHVPTGLNKNGLPLGFQVIAGHKEDRICLAVAKELEKKFGGWVPPENVKF